MNYRKTLQIALSRCILDKERNKFPLLQFTWKEPDDINSLTSLYVESVHEDIYDNTYGPDKISFKINFRYSSDCCIISIRLFGKSKNFDDTFYKITQMYYKTVPLDVDMINSLAYNIVEHYYLRKKTIEND
jgi:hypothetical protein